MKGIKAELVGQGVSCEDEEKEEQEEEGGNRGNIGEHTEPQRRQRKASGGERYHFVVIQFFFFWALSFLVSVYEAEANWRERERVRGVLKRAAMTTEKMGAHQQKIHMANPALFVCSHKNPEGIHLTAHFLL